MAPVSRLEPVLGAKKMHCHYALTVLMLYAFLTSLEATVSMHLATHDAMSLEAAPKEKQGK
jgi:hypothetical protein